MKNTSRRKFLKQAIIGSAGISMTPLLQYCRPTKDNLLRLGFIGLGQQAVNLMNGFNQIPGVRILAGADVYGIKRSRFENMVRSFYQDVGKNIKVVTYTDYRKILDRKDIDAVVIASPDHWHALMAKDACNAGKDIYLEKPITFTIRESLEVAKHVRQNNIVLAVGSQQRSDRNFRHAVKMVRDQAIGKLQKINAYVGPPPSTYNLPEEPVPADLDWDSWLGPNPYVHYNARLNPPISLDPPENENYWAEWRYFKETGGGFTTDWGAHNFDIGQWALGMDRSGPVRIIPPGYDSTEFLTYEYENGVMMTNEPWNEEMTRGVKFWGTNGWIEVRRGRFEASDPSLLPPMTGDNDPGEFNTSGQAHLINFLESVGTRKDPVADVDTGQRTCTVCCLGNIAHELKRPVKWNPEKQYFVNDPEAEKYYHREYREGYLL